MTRRGAGGPVRTDEPGWRSASLIHELRQPLFAIGAIARLLDVAEGADRARLAELLAQVDHARRLLDHYAAGGGASEPEAVVDLNDPVWAAVGLLAHRVRARGVTLVLDLSADPLPVRGRGLAFRQVTANLLANAIDAVADRSERTIGVRTRGGADHVVLAIEDTGPGVSREVRDRVFDAFVTDKGPGEGRGLGLAIVRRLVAEGGGTVTLNDRDRGGTRAEVRWPRADTGEAGQKASR